MMGSGNTEGVGGSKKVGETGSAAAGAAAGSVSGEGINWAKASLSDLKMAFEIAYGPEKGKKMFNQFQLMICQTCLSQMRELEPKKQDDQNQ